nr:chemosensory protein protein 3 [Diaphania glauculalis]
MRLLLLSRFIMKVFLFTVMAVLAPLVLCYDEKYDKIDVDKILGDDAVFTGYLNCLLDKGPCDLENSKEFRDLLPEVIATACAKCTPIQRKSVRKTVKAITEKKPDEFKEFINKYDPDHSHEKAFTAFVLADD